jgi:hypothetical protein
MIAAAIPNSTWLSLWAFTARSYEYVFLVSESLLPTMLAETIEERKRKINCKILQVHSGESNTPHPLLMRSNGDDSPGNVDFPRHMFPLDSPRCVPNASIQWQPFAWQCWVPKACISRRLAWQRTQSVQKALETQSPWLSSIRLRFTRKNTPYPTAILWVTPLRSRPTSKIKWHSALRGRTILFK